LRREFSWGNLKLDFLKVLVGGPRGLIEEGGQLVFLFVHLGEFYALIWGAPCKCDCGDQLG
jgi:hypothetical protein